MRFISLSVVSVFFSLAQLSASQTSTVQKRPNILLVLVDELRKPVIYESAELRQWMRDNLKTMTFLQENGVNFDNHYCASIACAPSRASLFTGQYPTLHGVSQTDGAAKSAGDSTMFWLSPHTVPTAGNIFIEGDYRTFYIGKWHISRDDLYNPGTQNAILSYNGTTGEPDPHLENVYRSANMLSPYGFNNGWIGPEPHGAPPHQSGASAAVGVSGRDVFYADETISLLQELDDDEWYSDQPWFVVCSFLNPHDITLYGDLTKNFPIYNFETDSSLPEIQPAPTANEDLSTKPTAQESYKEQYQNAFQPTTDTEEYRKLYYTLQKKVDAEIGRVLAALEETSFQDNTIVVFTSDHGDLLGAHGNFQKWFNMYEEAIHVPLTFYSPALLPKGEHIDLLTSHVDLLPTLCGLADINADSIIDDLQSEFSDATTLVGRDLSNLVRGTASDEEKEALKEPILFQTYDQILTGQYSINPVGTPYEYVSQPAFIDAIITQVDGQGIWKLAMYFENMNFVQAPLPCTCSEPLEPLTRPDIVQFEMYNLVEDPLETRNLADSKYVTDETQAIQTQLFTILQEQLKRKALQPKNSPHLQRELPVPS